MVPAVTAALKLSRGERYGHLTAVEQARFNDHHQLWWFKCSCGTVTVCKVHEVKSGHTRSCGSCGLAARRFRRGQYTTRRTPGGDMQAEE
jgi:hypothetical protein